MWIQRGAHGGADYRMPGGGCGGADVCLRQSRDSGQAQLVLAAQAPELPGKGAGDRGRVQAGPQGRTAG